MNCNRCQLAERIAEIVASPAAVDESELAALRRRCLSCDPAPLGHGGLVSFEAAGETIVESQMSADYRAARRPHGRVTELPQATEDALLDLLTRIRDLDFNAVGVLWCLLRGEGPDEMAKALKLRSRQTAHARIVAAVRRFPWLAGVYLRGRIGARETRVRPSEAVPRECAGGAY